MYYLWFNGSQSGPYTLAQMQTMWHAGQITADDLYWQEGLTEWKSLTEIAPLIEPSTTASLITKTAVIPELQRDHPRPPLTGAIHAPATTSEPARPEEELWRGHPTWWKWIGLLSGAILLILAAVALVMFAPNLPIWADLLPLPVAAIVVLYVYLVRRTILYSVTNKRVSLETGIFTRRSRELRIQDIRAIAAEVNFIGYGDIEFSSASNEDGNVTFLAVPRAGMVRDLVKKLQV